MLRALVALLLLLNALFLVWSLGWLDSLGLPRSRGDREPERAARQLTPDRIRIAGSNGAPSVTDGPRSCVETAPLDGEQALQTAQAVLQKLGIQPAQWQVQASDRPGVWAVATIKLPTKDFQMRKEETYKRMKIAFEYLDGPAEELPTMVLSRHASEKAAEIALEALSQRALKGLRVLPLQAPAKLYSVQIQADATQKRRLQALNNAALPGGVKSCQAAVAPSAASAASGA